MVALYCLSGTSRSLLAHVARPQIQANQRALSVREVSNNLLNWRWKLAHKCGNGENLVTMGELRVLEQVDNLDLILSGEMLLANLFEISECGDGLWRLAGDIQPQPPHLPRRDGLSAVIWCRIRRGGLHFFTERSCGYSIHGYAPFVALLPKTVPLSIDRSIWGGTYSSSIASSSERRTAILDSINCLFRCRSSSSCATARLLDFSC